MSAHLDIAKDRFLDLVVDGVPAGEAATKAIADANAFSSAYAIWEQSTAKPATVGCRACYGSGGKRSSPCKVCRGTGKIPATRQGAGHEPR